MKEKREKEIQSEIRMLWELLDKSSYARRGCRTMWTAWQKFISKARLSNYVDKQGKVVELSRWFQRFNHHRLTSGVARGGGSCNYIIVPRVAPCHLKSTGAPDKCTPKHEVVSFGVRPFVRPSVASFGYFNVQKYWSAGEKNPKRHESMCSSPQAMQNSTLSGAILDNRTLVVALA